MHPWHQFTRETSNKKIAIFEVDLPETIPFWINDSPGVYKYQYKNFSANITFNFQNGSFCYGSFQNSGTADVGINSTAYMISTLRVNGEQWARRSTLSACKRQVYTFYFDSSSTILYVNFFDVLPWNTASLKAGITQGFATQALYLNDIYYEPRLKSVPSISIKTDDLFFGIRRYSGGTVSMINNDGYFDDFVDQTVFGQECRIKLCGVLSDGVQLDYDDCLTLYTGYIEKFNTTPIKITITLGDKKDKIGRTLPVNHFNTTDYPDINTGKNGKPIPLVWGNCRGVPCVCVNEDEAGPPANYKFAIADITNHSIKTLSEVYIDGVSESGPALVNDTTDNIAYFNIASGGNYSPGQTVTADVTGFDDSAARDGSGTAIENALSIIEDIFDDYLLIPYNNDTFNYADWETEKSGAYDQGIWIGENTKISEIIEKICVGHLAIFFPAGDGRWNFKTLDDSARVQALIELDEIFSEPTKNDDGTQYLTSATVKHSENYGKGEHADYTDDSQESTIFAIYGIYRTKDFETYLSSAADAQTIAETITDEYNAINPEFSIITSIRSAGLVPFQTIVFEMNRRYTTWMGYILCRITGIRYLLNNPMRIEYDLKYVADDTSDAVIDMLHIKKDQDYTILISKYTANTNKIIVKKWR